MDQKVKAQEELATIKAKIVAMKSARETAYQERMRDLMNKEMEAQKSASEQKEICDGLRAQHAAFRNEIARINEGLEALRNRFREVFLESIPRHLSTRFVPPVAKICRQKALKS